MFPQVYGDQSGERDKWKSDSLEGTGINQHGQVEGEVHTSWITIKQGGGDQRLEGAVSTGRAAAEFSRLVTGLDEDESSLRDSW